MLRYIALFALLLITPAAAQDHVFPTPGNATVPGYVTMCIVANQAVPCAAGGSGITAGTTTTTGCGAAGVLFSLSGLVQCDTGFTYSGTVTGVVQLPDGAAAGGSVGVPGIAFVGAPLVGMRRNGTTAAIFTASSADIFAWAASQLIMRNNGSYGWSSSAAVTGSTDTQLVRNAAAVVQVTPANTGTMMSALFAPSVLFSAAGTALPACAAGTNGYTAIVSDNTAPTYRSAYVSGGAIVTRMICVSGTGWLSD